MRLTVFVACVILSAAACLASEEPEWTVTDMGDGIYGIELNSLDIKSVVVEYDNSLSLLEVALIKRGGTSKPLYDDTTSGRALLRLLKERFPTKPLTTVLHSHWHPHSLSSVTPFLEAGIKVYTTDSNFARISTAIDSNLLEQSQDLIQFVNTDSILIGQGHNRMIVYRLTKDNYKSLPSHDYLFFYFPERRQVHCGCMYNKWKYKPVLGREILSTREVDLHSFVTRKQLGVDDFIRINVEDSNDQTLSFASLQDVIENGISARTIIDRYAAISTDSLRDHRDRLIEEAVVANLPGSIFNTLVFRALGEQDFERALQFALFQVMVDPSRPNGWDTLGEVHYFLGNIDIARAYEDHSRRVDSTFTDAGEETWEKDLARYREQWNKEG